MTCAYQEGSCLNSDIYARIYIMKLENNLDMNINQIKSAYVINQPCKISNHSIGSTYSMYHAFIC